MRIDLREATYDEWLTFIFDHPVPPAWEDHDSSQAWYWQGDLQLVVDPIKQISFLTRFTQSADEILGRYTEDQIDQGLWYIFSAGGEAEFYDHLWNPKVPWELRERCIAALPQLWPRLFEQADVGTMSYMLWDSLAHPYDHGRRKPGDHPEDHRVQDAICDALRSQLSSTLGPTQYAALHGLGHLRHPDTQNIIEGFLGRSDIGDDLREYAAKILAGAFQ
jgi:hypothetical protein